ncbi:response regulator [Duganella sp. FT92W]|uniref:histidine kinase n=2 Tax=Pseudoduganella rivuli TaxID=2666085 RepID=A0A7X2IT51_9BURK|nr:response regulator [Pseudoduganella rivuli]
MGKRIADYDWTDTPLGDLHAWPQSLRTVVSLMLNSSHPMWIGWGPEATFLYNDAYIDVLSHAKHPLALGRPASQVWAEIWDYCAPLVDKVFLRGESSYEHVQLFMNRGSWIEETWYSFSYSPVVDESGGVGGLFCPSTNTTSSNQNTRRLASLSALSAEALREDCVAGACDKAMQAIAANPQDIPFALLYTIDNGVAHLQQAAHVPADHDAPGIAPACVVLHDDAAPPGAAPASSPASPPNSPFAAGAACRWPLRQLWLGGGTQLLPVGDFDALPLGLANQRITQALALPLQLQGQDRPAGVLVMGVSPACKLDGEYRTFFELVAGQVASAMQNARAAQAQRERADMLAELDQAKTAFFSNVSHEFRTPLTLMLGPLEDALADSAGLPPEQHGRLRLAHRNALRLQRLVNTLLDFSRVQAGRMHAAFAPTDLAALTSDLASGFRSIVEHAGLALDVHCAPMQGAVYVDASLWEKIVLNLLSNAFKFTFDGRISVTLEQQGGDAVLRVADSGVGIAPDDLPHIFERFRRIEGAKSRTHEGSGIGLALVRDLVELHHGAITVQSEPGKGTCFTVKIPVGRDHLRDDQITLAPATPTSSAVHSFASEAARWLPDHGYPPLSPPQPLLQPVLPPVSSEPLADATAVTAAVLAKAAALAETDHIIVADDNADMRLYLHRLLSERWRVTLVANGRAALECARADPPGLVISDVMMPELDGFGLIAALRADRRLQDTPILLLSARAGEEARIEGIHAGADDYLVKPFSARELLSRTEAQLIRYRLRQLDKAHSHRMAAVFEQAPMAIAILRGPGLVIELMNDRFRELVNGREGTGQPVRLAFPELQGQGVLEELEQAYASGRAQVLNTRRLWLARGPRGELEECHFDYVHQPVRNAAGRVDRVAVVAYEVTELVRARRAAEVANRAKDEFLAMLGHELRNPLSPILVALELMKLKGIDHVLREHAVIERQARHLVRLVDDLLDVARIAQGKVVLRRERVELAPLVAQAVETISSLLETRNHRLTVDVPAQGMALDADPVRFTQVLSNLLTNAAKYTNRNGSITVRAVADNGDCVLRVADNGIGIEPDMLPRLFDLFVQEHQALDRAHGGLGLGLAIVRSLVSLHGGTVSAHSPGPGQGSVFEVRLPLASGAVGTLPPTALPATAAPRLPDGQRLCIMLVDDNTDMLDALAELLALHGHDVHALSDPASALKEAERLQPDLAILDIGLPGMDGYELAAELRRRPQLAGLRLVALTGYGQAADQRRSAAAGFSAHLVKPVHPDQLAALIASHT